MASWKRRRTGTYHTSTTRWGDAASTLSRDSSAGDEQHSGVRTLVRRGLFPILYGSLAHHVDLRTHRKRDRRSGGRGDVLPRVFAAEDLTSWGVGAAGEHGALLTLPLVHTLAERRLHQWLGSDGLCSVVEEEHLREHGRSRPWQRHPDAVDAYSPTRSRPQLGYLKPRLVLLFTQVPTSRRVPR